MSATTTGFTSSCARLEIECRPAFGHPGFVVARDGRVIRLADGKTLPSRVFGKYLVVDIAGHTRSLHSVVCESFHGPPPCDDCEVHHKDRNKLNPHADNLEWLSRADHGALHRADGRHARRRRIKRPHVVKRHPKRRREVRRCGERPLKPRSDFPLFPNQNGQWTKKVKGKPQYFGSWCKDRTGERALARWAAGLLAGAPTEPNQRIAEPGGEADAISSNAVSDERRR